MYSCGCESTYPSAKPTSRAASEVATILDLREQALSSRDILYCSPLVRLLIEQEIPRLATLVGRTP